MYFFLPLQRPSVFPQSVPPISLKLHAGIKIDTIEEVSIKFLKEKNNVCQFTLEMPKKPSILSEGMKP